MFTNAVHIISQLKQLRKGGENLCKALWGNCLSHCSELYSSTVEKRHMFTVPQTVYSQSYKLGILDIDIYIFRIALGILYIFKYKSHIFRKQASKTTYPLLFCWFNLQLMEQHFCSENLVSVCLCFCVQVKYECLSDEIKIGDYYLRLLLEEDENEESGAIKRS